MSDRIVHVTVRDGLTGVNRVVSLLRHRGIGARSITARATADTDTWLIEHRLTANEAQTALLRTQLERLPFVVDTQHGPATSLA